MVTIEAARKFALSFEGAVELPHFHLTSFRVNKKIFASLDLKKQLLMVKLSEIDQSVFCTHDKTIIYPVHGHWGLQGATHIELKKVRVSVFKEALTISYCNVAPKKSAEKYRRE